jgi:uncharacterized OB-fold protein
VGDRVGRLDYLSAVSLESEMSENDTMKYAKPLPRITPDNKGFYDAAKRHELCLPNCTSCQRLHFPPSPVCPHCLSDKLEWKRMSGKGTVSTWVVFHRNWFPEFAADVPYAAVQVELAEGPRLTSSLVGVPNESIRMGMPVEVVFDDVTREVTLPRFRAIG